jgi:anti-sigma regulatory factor (Ser/Thr protein kinase)
VDAVLTDYRLPGISGLKLLEIIRERDENIAVVIITGQGEKAIVKESMALGAFDYMDKPVTYQVIVETMQRAVARTRKLRRYAADRQGLEELERFDQGLNERIPAVLSEVVSVVYRPLHEVGGDFFITHCKEGERCVILIGDISGHDIRSGYVSTYFQGLFHGYMEGGASVESALQLFNQALRRDGMNQANSAAPISLAASVIELQEGTDTVRHWNYGLTPCQIVSGDGKSVASVHGHFPLGWMETIDTTPVAISTEANHSLLLFTDGLLEYAGSLDVDLFSLFYRLMSRRNHFGDLPVAATDDILALKIIINPRTELNTTFEPILSEHYAGTEIEHIDHLQSVWRRSINFALGDALGDRLYDLLICIREGMINAFTHGCDRAPDKFAHLQISVDEAQKVLRIRIDDPGKGHKFDLSKRLEELKTQTGEHLGLGIIYHLSDDFGVDNNGTTLTFDFKITPEPEK